MFGKLVVFFGLSIFLLWGCNNRTIEDASRDSFVSKKISLSMAHLSTIKAEASRSAVGRVAGSQALVSFRLAVVSRDSTQPLLTHIYQASPRDWSDDYIKKKLFFNMEQGAILRVGKVSSPAITAIFENTPSINEKINIVYTFGVDTAALRGSEKCQVELTDLFFMPEQPVFTFATASLD